MDRGTLIEGQPVRPGDSAAERLAVQRHVRVWQPCQTRILDRIDTAALELAGGLQDGETSFTAAPQRITAETDSFRLRRLDGMVRHSPEIQAVMHRVVSAWNSRDLAIFNNLYLSDDRFRGIGTAVEEFWVGSEFMAVREAQFDEMPPFEMTLDRIQAFENDDTGWAASTGTLATPTGDHPLRVTAVFVLESGVWKIILWNTSIARSNLELFDIELTTTLNDLLDSVSEDSAAIASIGGNGEIVTLVPSPM